MGGGGDRRAVGAVPGGGRGACCAGWGFAPVGSVRQDADGLANQQGTSQPSNTARPHQLQSHRGPACSGWRRQGHGHTIGIHGHHGAAWIGLLKPGRVAAGKLLTKPQGGWAVGRQGVGCQRVYSDPGHGGARAGSCDGGRAALSGTCDAGRRVCACTELGDGLFVSAVRGRLHSSSSRQQGTAKALGAGTLERRELPGAPHLPHCCRPGLCRPPALRRQTRPGPGQPRRL